jgi:hypothetical protein
MRQGVRLPRASARDDQKWSRDVGGRSIGDAVFDGCPLGRVQVTQIWRAIHNGSGVLAAPGQRMAIHEVRSPESAARFSQPLFMASNQGCAQSAHGLDHIDASSGNLPSKRFPIRPSPGPKSRPSKTGRSIANQLQRRTRSRPVLIRRLQKKRNANPIFPSTMSSAARNRRIVRSSDSASAGAFSASRSAERRYRASGLSAQNLFSPLVRARGSKKEVCSQAVRILSGCCVDAEAGSYHKPLLIAAI